MVVGIILIRKLPRSGILILLLVITASIPQLARGLIDSKKLQYIFYNINIPIEITILFLFFKPNIITRLRSEVLSICYYASLLFGIFLLFYHHSFSHFLNEWVCVNYLFFTGWILMLLLEIYERDEVQLHPGLPLFWFILGLFSYCCCTALVFSLWNYIRLNENTLLVNLWIVHDFFNILMYIFFSYGFMRYNRKIYFK